MQLQSISDRQCLATELVFPTPPIPMRATPFKLSIFGRCKQSMGKLRKGNLLVKLRIYGGNARSVACYYYTWEYMIEEVGCVAYICVGSVLVGLCPSVDEVPLQIMLCCDVASKLHSNYRVLPCAMCHLF